MKRVRMHELVDEVKDSYFKKKAICYLLITRQFKS